MLKEKLHLSYKALCRNFLIANGTCLRILHNTLGMKSSIFVGFPMPWTSDKADRVVLSHGILSVLQSVRCAGFQSVIAAHESWFFLYFLRDSIWVSSRDEVPERASQKMAQKGLISFL
jgi:hypothetical protein